MENLKNYLLNQDIFENRKNLKLKIFEYFYSILNRKKLTSFFILYLFHTIEIFQLHMLFLLLINTYGNYQKKQMILLLDYFQDLE